MSTKVFFWPLMVSLLMGAAIGPAVARQPLLMEGKKTLYQRVLTRPGAELSACKDSSCRATVTPNEEVPTFTIYYVYEQRDGRFLVGPDARGKLAGWLPVTDTVPWKHSMVLSFIQPSTRGRVPFFKTQESLVDFIGQKRLDERLKSVYSSVDRDGPDPLTGVIAMEPAAFIDIRKQFYLLPVLHAEQTRLKLDGGRKKRLRVVKVASVAEPDAGSVNSPDDKAPSASARANPLINDFRAAMVFVIDASGSMQREIDSARQAIVDIYRKVEREQLADKVRFGLIGYRDDPGAVPGIGYLEKIFVDPSKVESSDKFLEEAQGLSASRVSTRSWAEDGFAGLSAAINEIDWEGFGGRYVIFITDASSRGAKAGPDGTPASVTGLNAKEINGEALEKGIAIFTMHILTEKAERIGDVAKARPQYQSVSQFPGVDSLYYPVPAARDNEAGFRGKVDTLAQALVNQVRQASGGRATEAPEQDASPARQAGLSEQDKVQAVGRAMQLAWVGRQSATRAPPMIEAWTTDKALDQPLDNAMQVRILLTRAQLNDLRQSVKGIQEAAVATERQKGSEAFFSELRRVAAKMGRDPALRQTDIDSLNTTGLVAEYLEGLPYQSVITSMSAADWEAKSASERVEFSDDLQSKLIQYGRIYEDSDNWLSLHEGGDRADDVYAMPLGLLP